MLGTALGIIDTSVNKAIRYLLLWSLFVEHEDLKI